MSSKRITVTVDEEGQVSCSPDELKVRKSRGSVLIKWRMAKDKTSKLYEVTNVRIIDDEGQFYDKGKDVGDGWKMRDRNNNRQLYKYDITVALKSTGEEITLDPGIRNGGRRAK